MCNNCLQKSLIKAKYFSLLRKNAHLQTRKKKNTNGSRGLPSQTNKNKAHLSEQDGDRKQDDKTPFPPCRAHE